jgi:hypothetical protein
MLLTMSTEKYLYRSPLTLDALSLEVITPGEPHPNKAPFRGVLTRVGEASTRPPNGSGGHKVFISHDVATAALPSLQGMPIDCSDTLNDHDKKRVIGIIERGHIEGQDLIVEGYLLEKNWPEEVSAIRHKKHLLGMSYEISSVEVEDTSAPVWVLQRLVFTGAAILRRDAAAYQQTSIAAMTEENPMAEADAANILDKLNTINVKLDLAAAHDADADEEAARQDDADAAALDEEATAAERSAEAARTDQDTEDASRHDEMASTKRQAASAKRLAAMTKYEALAARAKEASDPEAVATYTAAATRLHVAHTEQQATVAKIHAAREQWAASHATQDASSDARMLKLFGMFVKAMDAMEEEDAAQEDEADDTAFFKKLMKKKGGDQKASTVPDLQTRRWQRTMEASMQLLTDTVSKMAGLITDVEHRTRGLATDVHRGNNGGPVRTTMHATGVERWTGKFAAQQPTDDKQTVEEIHAATQAKNLSLRDSIAQTLTAAWDGKLK